MASIFVKYLLWQPFHIAFHVEWCLCKFEGRMDEGDLVTNPRSLAPYLLDVNVVDQKEIMAITIYNSAWLSTIKPCSCHQKTVHACKQGQCTYGMAIYGFPFQPGKEEYTTISEKIFRKFSEPIDFQPKFLDFFC